MELSDCVLAEEYFIEICALALSTHIEKSAEKSYLFLPFSQFFKRFIKMHKKKMNGNISFHFGQTMSTGPQLFAFLAFLFQKSIKMFAVNMKF